MRNANDPFSNVRQQAQDLINRMTLEEKAGLCAGRDFWHTYPVERLGLPSVMITDGPNGLRKQPDDADHLGLNDSVPATCFPAAAATACSFDPELAWQMGEAIGEECLEERVAMILGPAANIKRSPLCGRNFEYFSEDPLLTGEIAAGMIGGIQSKNVGASMKHYLANNQEKARLVSDSVVDERALREIYMTGFEIAVKKSQPWSLMCSYNRINGVYASDNKRMMTDVLRDEWGCQGFVVTDWGAMNERIAAVKAGLDLEMPGPARESCRKIMEAVETGELSEDELDTCARRVAAFVLQTKNNTPDSYNRKSHNALAGHIAAESAVLLRRGKALPASPESRIAVIGAFAQKARYQGAGSGKIHPHKVTSLCDALDSRGINYLYAPGYWTESAEPDEMLIAQALETAKNADVVFACVGLPDSFESEGFDRSHIQLPEAQNVLMEALTETDVPVVAVLSTGSVVYIPWREKADSILLMYLAGQNGGHAAADLLFGDAVPCGKLAESWPLSLEDTPSLRYFGMGGRVEYRESIYVGYRYYDKAGIDVQYPFGHGLSYTDFTYTDMVLDRKEMTDRDTLNISLTVKNTGTMAGKEIVQLYVAPPRDNIFRPVRELRAFKKVFLEPGESTRVHFVLDYRAFAYYNVKISDWFVSGGCYRIEAAASSRDIRLSAEVDVCSTQPGEEPDLCTAAPVYYKPDCPLDIPKEQFENVLGHKVQPWPPVRPFTRNSTIGELRSTPIGRQLAEAAEAGMQQMAGSSSEDIGAMMTAMLEDMPLRQFGMFGSAQLGEAGVDGLLAMLNHQP